VLIFKPINKEAMDIESGKIAYSVEFSFNYEVGSAASSEG